MRAAERRERRRELRGLIQKGGNEMSIHADRIIAVRTTKIVYLDGDTVVKVFDSDYSKADVLN